MATPKFRFGTWLVDPGTNTLSSEHGERHIEPRTMDVLVTLCQQPGQILSSEDLLQRCWGSTLHGDNPVHKTLALLRRALGDQAGQPRYIATIRKRGYHTIAPISLEAEVPVPETWFGDSPFCGLEPFDLRRAPVFYGRSQALAQLEQTLQTLLTAKPEPSVTFSGPGLGNPELGSPALTNPELLLVLGPSGAGKTSLIQAGLMPKLLYDPLSPCRTIAWSKLDLGEIGTVELFTAIGSCLLDWQEDPNLPQLFNGHSAVSLGAALAASDELLIHALDLARQAQTKTDTNARYVLFIDRLEALFHNDLIPRQHAQRLMALLACLAHSGQVFVLLACRNDFYPQLAAYPLLSSTGQTRTQFDLAPPSGAEIAQMIRLPAAAAGLYYDTDKHGARLDDVLCQHASDSPDALPLLQYTLQELYRAKSKDGALRSSHYWELGGLEGAISQRAEAIIAQLSAEQRDCLPQVFALVATVSPSDGAITSHRAPWSALPNSAAQTLVQALIESRLFVSDLSAGIPGFSIAHEALLRRWPRALDWIENHRGALRTRARLNLHSQRWHENQRRADLLLPAGLPLEEGERLLRQQMIQLPPLTQVLIQVSRARAQRQQRFRQAAFGVILLLALLASVFAVQAIVSQRLALQRQDEAEGLLGFMLGEFAERLRPLGRLDLLDSVSTRALDYLAQSSNGMQRPQAQWQRARALQVLGEVSMNRGQADAAQAAFSAAHKLLEELQQQSIAYPETSDSGFSQARVLQDLGVNAFWLGKLQMDHGDWEESGRYFHSYLTSSQQLVALEPERNEWWVELSYAHNNLGSLALKRGQYADARQSFSASIEIKARALSQDSNNAVLSAELADSLSWLGALEESQAEFLAALELYQRELTLIQQLRHSHPDDTRWANRQALALIHQAELQFVRGETVASAEALQLADQLLAELHHKEPENRTWQRTQAYTQLWQFRLRLLPLLNANTLNQAAKVEALKLLWVDLEKLQQLAQELINLDPERMEWLRLDASVHIYQARLAWLAQQTSALIPALEQAEHSLLSALERSPADVKSRQLQAEVQLLRADWSREQNELGQARTHCQQALDGLGPDALESRDYHLLDPLIRALYCLNHSPSTQASSSWQEHHRQLINSGYREPYYLAALAGHTQDHNAD